MNEHSGHQANVMAAVGQVDITPPLGIYHRMWGAAKHDRATSIHRPLTATLLWIAPNEDDPDRSLAIVSLDHCILDAEDVKLFRESLSRALGIGSQKVMICLTHTHAAGLMSRSRRDCPGGELIEPYLNSVAEKLAVLGRENRRRSRTATIVFGKGNCSLAAERDYWDADQSRYVCGFNPEGIADDTLVVGKVISDTGDCLGTIVNYACHPTTLAWDNQAISPDYVGAMRELVERETGAPCLFLQGASGDLGPRRGFVGDTQIADQNGRQLGHAVLSILASLDPPNAVFRYQGSVVSGTHIGTWKHETLPVVARSQPSRMHSVELIADLPYRHDLADLASTRQDLEHWRLEEQKASALGNEDYRAHCRAMAEQMQRQVWRLNSLPSGKCFPMPLQLATIGNSRWLFVPGEHYQFLQTTLRARFPDELWLVVTLCNGWQPGYIPPASKYGYGIYQEEIAVVGPGSAEIVLETVCRSAAFPAATSLQSR